jgi:Zn ribbon nucleic-acid-binding protein
MLGDGGDCKGCAKKDTHLAWWRRDVEEHGAITVCLMRVRKKSNRSIQEDED